MNDYADRVAAGVKWLDEVKPNWRGAVNLHVLAMTMSSRCIIGQVFGNFWNVVDSSSCDCGVCESFPSLTNSQAIELGFQVHGHACDGGAEDGCEYGLLEEEWRKVLSA